ncbi:MAG: bifunctional hydroxymethylpyrimidine kinase/phosphomethylpyrimidine kinase [Oscillospiraceae bacterium]|nr:bifunctional hydroxymethylpyrimidine kinase/phosphomethylpyrimidine kinase [Oscillospiraceae bacterium]
MKSFLTIAGSDCSGGAGVQADMRTAVLHGLFPMSVITALTAQTRLGVRDVLLTPPELVAKQLDAVFNDRTPDVIKIGMLGSGEIVEAVAEKICEHGGKSIVLDTVFMSSSGHALLSGEGITALREKLLPLCDVITPNIPEAEFLTGMRISGAADMEACAVRLSNIFRGNIIITGGHLNGACDDLLFADGKLTWFHGEKIESENTHGTGCTFSSCVACNLALGQDLEESVRLAKEYVARLIQQA